MVSSRKKDGNYGTMHRLLKILAWRYATPSELAKLLGVSRQTVHYHLRRLKQWGFVVESTRECIMAKCLDREWRVCILEENGKIKTLSCETIGKGGVYVYSASSYLRKLFPARPAPSWWNPPTTFMDIVRRRLAELGVLENIKGYDFILMTAIIALMAAVIWNPAPRGNSYWVRLRHLTARGITEKVQAYIDWYAHMKAAKEIKKQRRKYLASTVWNPTDKSSDTDFLSVFIKYSEKYKPSIGKVRWILAKMYDYMIVERLGGGHCPYGVWIPHPSLFSPNGKPDFHLPKHRHVRAKHRYKPLGVKQTITAQDALDNQNN